MAAAAGAPRTPQEKLLAARELRLERVFPRTVSDMGARAREAGVPRRVVLAEQLGPGFIPESLPGLEQQQAELREALEATLLHGHNSAILLVGQRGSGKSAALRRVLLELKRLHNPSGLSFQEVYVSGTLHTDDRAALREITRQLCRENEIELLRSESFAENLRFVTQVLSQTKEAGIPVLFIVDEFDAFTRSAKQALLYNLSELLHSQRASMAVIGLSSRLDAYDRLEKRIRSRITYRKIVFTHLRDDQCVAAALQQALLLPAAESAVDAPPLKRRRGAATANTEGEVSDAGAAHNRAVTALLASAELRALLQRNLQLGRDMGWFFNLAREAVSALHDEDEPLSMRHFEDAERAISANLLEESLQDCSALELSVLVAACQLERRGATPINLTLLARELERASERSGAAAVAERYARPVVYRAFERVCGAGLLWPVGASARGVSRFGVSDELRLSPFEPVALTVEPDAVRRCVASARSGVPTWLRQWSAGGSSHA